MRITTGAGLLLLVAACASTPQAPQEQDRKAKAFEHRPDRSTIYVYRPEFQRPPDDSLLQINGQLIGATLPKAYFRVDVDPGSQHFSGIAGDYGTMRLETRPGEIYFVRLDLIAGRSDFELVDSAKGRRELLACCALLENWRPGQRPLLR